MNEDDLSRIIIELKSCVLRAFVREISYDLISEGK